MAASLVLSSGFGILGSRLLATAVAPLVVTAGLSGFSPASAESERSNFSAWNNVQQTAPTVTFVAENQNLPPLLGPLTEAAMRDAIARYEIIAARGGWPSLPDGHRLSKGGRGSLVAVLRERLAIEGYLPHMHAPDPETFDDGLVAALQRFQKNHGLMPSGVVDEDTRRALNMPAEAKIATLRANLPRVTEYAKGLTDRYIVINIPAAQLETVEYGRVYSRHNVVAGKTDRPSPVVLSRVSDITFNPYWTAPVSIVEKDILPKVREDPNFLAEMKIRVFDGFGGPEVDPAMIDWYTVAPDRYIFRQDPGDNNAMATVKIHFPNTHAVYMHDTPTKYLFTQQARYFSSGCVRVDQVHIVTDWLLRDEGWNRSGIEQVVASGELTEAKLTQNVAVRMVYLTAWATPDGEVNFRPDIYRLDGSGFVVGQPEPFGEEFIASPPQGGTGQQGFGRSSSSDGARLQPAVAVNQSPASSGGAMTVSDSDSVEKPVTGARDAWQRYNYTARQRQQ